MDFLVTLLDFFLHLDVHLGEIILNYGVWTYAILFLIIFMETGFVVTPFLPGDSLLFAAGTFAALGSLDPILLFFLLFGAAVLGDTINYWIGSVVGERAFEKDRRFLNREHLEKTQRFYEKHGGKTIVTSLFIFGGYFVGNIPVVKENFEIVIIVIILISVLPMVVEYINSRREKKPEEPTG